jgi:aspartate racemase
VKKIGLIGGMSVESSRHYSQLIHEMVKEILGGLNCARIIEEDLNFQEIFDLMQDGNWDKIAEIIKESAQILERAGADCILICTNTVHKIFNKIRPFLVKAKLIHIGDPVAIKARQQGLSMLGLLGTKATMQGDFYQKWLDQYGIKVIVPDDIEEMDIVDRIIFNELCLGKFNQSSIEDLSGAAYSLIDRGVSGIILGCTELPLVLKQEEFNFPLFNTLELHAKAAVDFALK